MLAIFAIFLSLNAPNLPVLPPLLPPVQEIAPIVATSTVLAKIDAVSAKYGVSRDMVYKIVVCETAGTFDPTIQSQIIKNGIQEDSWGLAQIHLPDHPDISKQQAIDPDFALDYLASKLSEHKGFLWSCYKQMYTK